MPSYAWAVSKAGVKYTITAMSPTAELVAELASKTPEHFSFEVKKEESGFITTYTITKDNDTKVVENLKDHSVTTSIKKENFFNRSRVNWIEKEALDVSIELYSATKEGPNRYNSIRLDHYDVKALDIYGTLSEAINSDPACPQAYGLLINGLSHVIIGKDH
jgi:hypothetical protein